MSRHTITLDANRDRLSNHFGKFEWVETVDGVELQRRFIERYRSYHNDPDFDSYEEHAWAVARSIAGTYGAAFVPARSRRLPDGD